MVKSCKFCGRFFVPDKRVGARQKACGQERCKKARKHLSQNQWTKKNPAYFKGRYEYVKEWRQRQKEVGKKVIQDKIPSEKPWYKLVLLVPGEQDEMDARRSKILYFPETTSQGRI